jgi:hypothetical protein
MNMPRSLAAFVGFLAASLVPPIVFLLLAGNPGVGAIEFLGAFLGLLFFSVVAVALLGVPTFLVLFRLRMVRWWSTLATGLGAGAVVGYFLRAPNPPEIYDVLTTAFAGGAAALAFWLVWEMRSAPR